MQRWLIVIVAVVGLAAAAVVEGMFSNRWGASGDLRAASAKLDGVPAAFGDWTSTEQPQDPKVIRVAEATNHVSRIYTNRKKNINVSVLMLCGPSGPIGAHTPERCYEGGGYEAGGTPQKKTVVLPDQTVSTYWIARFEKKGAPLDNPLQVAWMWGVDGGWEASASPRSDFALRKALYKLYVQRSDVRPPGGSATAKPAADAPDPIQEFLTDFLPEVKKALAAPAGQPDAK
jgi:hypothetical protein